MRTNGFLKINGYLRKIRAPLIPMGQETRRNGRRKNILTLVLFFAQGVGHYIFETKNDQGHNLILESIFGPLVGSA